MHAVKPKVLSVQEVAVELGVHPNTIKRLDDLPFFRVGKRGDRRYRRTDVERWIQERTET